MYLLRAIGGNRPTSLTKARRSPMAGIPLPASEPLREVVNRVCCLDFARSRAKVTFGTLDDL
jgi:hypothetical protein